MKGVSRDVGASLPLRIGAALVVLGGAALALLGNANQAADAALLPPPLDLGGPACPVSVDQATARSRIAERAALGRMARYPFDAEDGVEAVALLHEAALCARSDGDAMTSERLEALERTWNARVRADYRARIVRVKMALEREPRAVAIHEVTELARMLKRSPGEYSTWLEATKRRLERAGDRP